MTDRLDDAVRAGIADVVVADRHDIDASVSQAHEKLRIEGEGEPMRVPTEGVDGGPLEIDQGQVGVPEQVAHGIDLVELAHDGQPIAGGRAAAPAGDPREAPVPRVVRSLALPDRALVDRSVEHHVAAGDQGPRRGRVEGPRRLDTGCRRGEQRPCGDVSEVVVAEQVEAVQREGVHVGGHVAGREQTEGPRVRVHRRTDRVRGRGCRSRQTSRGEDASVRDARSCQRRVEVVAGQAGRCRPEADHRHERDRGRGRDRRRGRRDRDPARFLRRGRQRRCRGYRRNRFGRR